MLYIWTEFAHEAGVWRYEDEERGWRSEDGCERVEEAREEEKRKEETRRRETEESHFPLGEPIFPTISLHPWRDHCTVGMITAFLGGRCILGEIAALMTRSLHARRDHCALLIGEGWPHRRSHW